MDFNLKFHLHIVYLDYRDITGENLKALTLLYHVRYGFFQLINISNFSFIRLDITTLALSLPNNLELVLNCEQETNLDANIAINLIFQHSQTFSSSFTKDLTST